MSVNESVDIVVPSSPADREAIFAVIKECSNSLTRSEAENDYRKDAIKELGKKYDIKPKYLSRMLKEFHKDLFEKKAEEQDAFGDLYEAIVPT